MRDGHFSAAAASYGQLIATIVNEGAPYPSALLEAYLSRGTAYFKDNRFQSAARDFFGAWSIERKLTAAALVCGEAYCKAGMKDQAVEVFEELHSLSGPDDRQEIAAWVANIYRSAGASKEMRTWIGRAGQPYQDRFGALAIGFSGRYEESRDVCQKILASNPDDRIGLIVLGWSLLRLTEGRSGPTRDEEFHELVVAAERAFGLYPEEIHAVSLLSLVRLAEGNIEAALSTAALLEELESRLGNQQTMTGYVRSFIATSEEDLAQAENLLRHGVKVADGGHRIFGQDLEKCWWSWGNTRMRKLL